MTTNDQSGHFRRVVKKCLVDFLLREIMEKRSFARIKYEGIHTLYIRRYEGNKYMILYLMINKPFSILLTSFSVGMAVAIRSSVGCKQLVLH